MAIIIRSVVVAGVDLHSPGQTMTLFDQATGLTLGSGPTDPVTGLFQIAVPFRLYIRARGIGVSSGAAVLAVDGSVALAGSALGIGSGVATPRTAGRLVGAAAGDGGGAVDVSSSSLFFSLVGVGIGAGDGQAVARAVTLLVGVLAGAGSGVGATRSALALAGSGAGSGAGAGSATVSASETTAPSVGELHVPNTTGTAITGITVAATTDAVGVVGWMIKEVAHDGTFTAPIAGDSGWTAISPADTSWSTAEHGTLSFTSAVTSTAERDFRIYFKDAAGNVGASATESATITIIASAITSPSASATVSSPVTFSGTAPTGTGVTAELWDEA